MGVPDDKKSPRFRGLSFRSVFRLANGGVDSGGLGRARIRRALPGSATRIARGLGDAARERERADFGDRDRATESGGEGVRDDLPASETTARVPALRDRRADRGGRRLPASENERGARAVLAVVDLGDEADNPRLRRRPGALRDSGRRASGGVGIDGRRIAFVLRVLREGESGDLSGGEYGSDSYLSGAGAIGAPASDSISP
jgi:hypothetical protein